MVGGGRDINIKHCRKKIYNVFGRYKKIHGKSLIFFALSATVTLSKLAGVYSSQIFRVKRENIFVTRFHITGVE